MKTVPMLALLLAALPPLAVRMPGRSTLELHDVQDITYGMSDMPGIDISLAGAPPDVLVIDYWTLEDLAAEVRAGVPCSVQAQNGLLIVRATRLQHAAVRLRLAAARAWIHAQEATNRVLSRLLAP